MFYHNLEIFVNSTYLISQVNSMAMGLDEGTLSEILGVPIEGIRSIKSERDLLSL